MKIEKLILAVLLALVSVLTVSAQTIDEKVYKEVIRYGEKVSRWLLCKSIHEYDRRGNEIYFSNSGHTYESEYDSENRLIMRNIPYMKDGITIYHYDFDSKGNVIHMKTSGSSYEEEWYEYDSKGNCIHKARSYENYFYEYDELGRVTCEKHSYSSGKSKTQYTYNESNTLIHSKSEYDSGYVYECDYDKYGNKTREYSSNDDTSHYYEYDKFGNVIHQIDYDTKTKHIKWEWWNDYEYWEDGKPKKMVVYESYYYY